MGEQTTERLQIGGAIVASLALFAAAYQATSLLDAAPYFAIGLFLFVGAVTFAMRSRP